MNTPLACLAVLASAALTAMVSGTTPPEMPTQNEPAAPECRTDTLETWRERAARAEAWLKGKATSAEGAAAAAMARARRELLGVDTTIAAATLALATRPAEGDGDDAPEVKWVGLSVGSDTAKMVVLLETNTAKMAVPREIVLLVHGLDEPGTIWDELTPHLLDHGATVVRFDYANDQGLEDSANDLAGVLRRLSELGVARVSIVAHSMGGLVARQALTSDSGYAGDGAGGKGAAGVGEGGLPAIERLIMVGTPNHGSPLAHLQAVAEAREQVVRRVQGTAADGSGVLGYSGDGCGEAGRDLCIGSDFLKTLNARPNPKNVAITTISGIATPSAACSYLKDDAARQWAGLLGRERAEALALQACEAVETLGDGMVGSGSPRIDGVEDHVEIAADHRSMLKQWTIVRKLNELRGKPTPPAEAIPVILDRLGLEALPEGAQAETLPRAE